MKIIIAVFRLYLIQIFAFGTATLSMYIPGVDLICSVLYLIIIFAENRTNIDLSNRQKLAVAALWQGPAAFLAFYTFFALRLWSLNDYAIFILQFWGAPLLPLWSMLKISITAQYPLYYYLILTTPLCMAAFYLLASITKNHKKLTNPLVASNR